MNPPSLYSVNAPTAPSKLTNVLARLPERAARDSDLASDGKSSTTLKIADGLSSRDGISCCIGSCCKAGGISTFGSGWTAGAGTSGGTGGIETSGRSRLVPAMLLRRKFKVLPLLPPKKYVGASPFCWNACTLMNTGADAALEPFPINAGG